MPDRNNNNVEKTLDYIYNLNMFMRSQSIRG